MSTNDLDFVKQRLEEARPSRWEEISRDSHVPLGTLRKVAYGEVSDPRFWTVKKLADYFRSAEAKQSTPRRRTTDKKSP